MGYGLLNRNQHDKAVKIFKYNLELYPKSFNSHDSLAEAFLILGDKENAVKYCQLAVKLNPGDGDYAKRALKNFKLKFKGVAKNFEAVLLAIFKKRFYMDERIHRAGNFFLNCLFKFDGQIMTSLNR